MARSDHTHAVRILLALFAIEASALLVLIGIYKTPAYDWTLLFTEGVTPLILKSGVALAAGGIGLVASGWNLGRHLSESGAFRARALTLGLATNLLTGLLVLLLMEVTVRTVAKRADEGIVIGSVAVRPTWPELKARSRDVLSGAVPWGNRATYFVYDKELGWTVGRNRQSADGLYFSSVEGLRSARPNLRLADRTPRYRVALIGDSNAFSLEVPFEDSWSYHLERLLGDDVQVLNFGVDGYGIDQMYLRYRRDVVPWKPQVVVVGFIAYDLERTMAVYPVVSYGWPGYLVKPRFTLENGELKLLNVPLPPPGDILSTARIDQLPFVEYDLGYGTTQRYWRFDHGPLFLRFLTSAFPRSPIATPQVSEDATAALNARLITELVKSIKQAGAVPLLVLMSSSNSLVRETFTVSRVPVLDATGCLTGVPADRRKVPNGNHYTGPANAAIARCTSRALQVVLEKLGRETLTGALAVDELAASL